MWDAAREARGDDLPFLLMAYGMFLKVSGANVLIVLLRVESQLADQHGKPSTTTLIMRRVG